jgi:hypothetical protein
MIAADAVEKITVPSFGSRRPTRPPHPPASGTRTPAKAVAVLKRGAGITRTALISAQNGHLVWPGFAPCGFSHVGTAKLRTFAY